MKILHISATDIIGGAGIAAYRLHQGLSQIGVDSQMLVYKKATSDDKVHRLLARMNRWNRLQVRYAMQSNNRQLKANPRRPNAPYWSLNRHNHAIAKIINEFKADVVHLHWISDNFLPIQAFEKINAPIVWTLHDMWAMTGGCHHAADCDRYQQTCGNCPQLVHPSEQDISYQVLRQKQNSWRGIPLKLICPSQWLANRAKASSVFHDTSIEVIPNGIDIQLFKPIEQTVAREAFNLPLDKKLVLFGAFGGKSDPNKGFHHLEEALHMLAKQSDSDIELVMFGADYAETVDLPLPVHQIGHLRDTVGLALLYSACDAFVLPSLQENLPNTIMESLACGTPCIAFNIGGIPDLIEHQHNGYLVPEVNAEALSSGIQWLLDNSQKLGLGENARQKVESSFSLTKIAHGYHDLYQLIRDHPI